MTAAGFFLQTNCYRRNNANKADFAFPNELIFGERQIKQLSVEDIFYFRLDFDKGYYHRKAHCRLSDTGYSNKVVFIS